jgi:hypothetical protein
VRRLDGLPPDMPQYERAARPVPPRSVVLAAQRCAERMRQQLAMPIDELRPQIADEFRKAAELARSLLPDWTKT